MTEQWRDVKGYEGRYQVSDLGNVRTVEHYIPHNQHPSVMKRVRARMRKLQDNGHGYKTVVLGKSNMQLVHRLIGFAFLEKTEGKDFINHKNGIKADNRAENLEWCTRQENETHAFTTGLKNSSGECNKMAVLKNIQIPVIRQLVGCGRKRGDVAKQFNVSRATVSRIAAGKIWANV